MNNPKYLYKSDKKHTLFEFISTGPKGRIKKVIQYTETSTKNVFNLGFGDFNETTKGIDDLSVSNNGDSLKVLATVASTVYAFLEKHPDAWIIATGSTAARNRLYRMGITKYIAEINQDFSVYGYSEDGIWEEFTTGVAYEAFLLTKKTDIFA
jgi:hypothetical protein